jgi:methionine aminotransferase
MSQLAADHNAINLSQGFPDYDCDPKLISLVADAMKSGHNQYAPMPGIPSLRTLIADKVNLQYGSDYHPDTEITITPGNIHCFNSMYTAG